MFLAEPQTSCTPGGDRRGNARRDIQCRARIIIGTRHYAGYLHNPSRGRAKMTAITPTRNLGAVLLRLPDLPPLNCQLKRTDSYTGGVAFECALSRSRISYWAQAQPRTGVLQACDVVDVESGG